MWHILPPLRRNGVTPSFGIVRLCLFYLQYNGSTLKVQRHCTQSTKALYSQSNGIALSSDSFFTDIQCVNFWGPNEKQCMLLLDGARSVPHINKLKKLRIETGANVISNACACFQLCYGKVSLPRLSFRWWCKCRYGVCWRGGLADRNRPVLMAFVSGQWS